MDILSEDLNPLLPDQSLSSNNVFHSLFTQEYYKGTKGDQEVLVNVEGCVLNGGFGLSAYLMVTKVVTMGLFLCTSFVNIQQLWDKEMENELLTLILVVRESVIREPHKEKKL